ncbi:MAG: hypothetical protein OXI35_14395, partial [Gemmatimonadota bacterium]|nr:hypothetical protein [Gemmatimonadota bacterium]
SDHGIEVTQDPLGLLLPPALTLEVSREIGLRRVLVTCDSDNIGSRKIIEHNGGQFESAMAMPNQAFRAEDRKPAPLIEKLRYWIDL